MRYVCFSDTMQNGSRGKTDAEATDENLTPINDIQMSLRDASNVVLKRQGRRDVKHALQSAKMRFDASIASRGRHEGLSQGKVSTGVQ